MSDRPKNVDRDSVAASELREASLSGMRWVSMARLLAEVITVGSAVEQQVGER